MKRKAWALFLIFICVAGAIGQDFGSVTYARAAKDEELSTDEVREEIIALTGIMTFQPGNVSDTQIVSRARFAKLLKLAGEGSSKSVIKPKTAMYKDVSKKNKYAGYIKLAVDSGLMSGYSNGTFRPNNGILLKDAADAAVALLGYAVSEDGTKLTRSKRLSKFYQLGLNRNIEKGENKALSQKDCMNLFYNLLNTKNKSGQYYGQVLGYTMTDDGEIDLGTLIIEEAHSPLVAEAGWESSLPFPLESGRVYKNEVLSQGSAIEEYNAVYYHKSSKTVWAYDGQVTGTIDSIAPNNRSPKTITISGETYELETAKVKKQVSAGGTIEAGDRVTVVLGAKDGVAAILTDETMNGSVTGVVIESDAAASQDPDDSYIVYNYIVVVDTKGKEHTYRYDYTGSTFKEGDAVKVTVTNGVTAIEKLTVDKSKFSSAKFSNDASMLGNTPLDANAVLVDAGDKTSKKIKASQLAGVTLSTTNILYYEMDGAKITCLILSNVTGIDETYCLITEVEKKETASMMGGSVSYTITYLVNGNEKVLNVSEDYVSGNYYEGSLCYLVKNEEDDGDYYIFYPLSSAKVTGISTNTITTVSGKKELTDDIVVYFEAYNKLKEKEYYKTTIDKVKNLSAYSLTAYYDSRDNKDKSIRIIIAKNWSN